MIEELRKKYNIPTSRTDSEILEIVRICKLRKLELSSDIFQSSLVNFKRISTKLKRNNIPFTTSALTKTPNEVDSIIKIIKKEHIPYTDLLFTKSVEEINEIINICKLNHIKVKSFMFQYSSSHLKEVIKLCQNNNLKISSNILSRTKEEIEEIINVCRRNNQVILDTMFKRKPNEIEEIILYSKEKQITITDNSFLKTPSEFKRVISTCDNLGLIPTNSILKRTPEEIEQIVKIYQDLLGQLPNSNSFNKTPEEVEKIIKLCLKNDISVTGTVFHKTAKELEESISFIKEKYGEDYLLPQIIICDKGHIERIFSYLKGRHCLEVIKESQGIMRLTLDEIIEREIYITSINESFVVDGIFNPIIGLSKRLWEKKKTEELKNKTGGKK